MTVKEWIDSTFGKRYDMDGYYGAQCWDYFAYFVYAFKLALSVYCKLTHYAGDLWKLRYEYGYYKYFDFITDVNQIKDGDWCFWDKHVAMYYHGMQYGQNQHGYACVTAEPFDRTGFLGAMRYKGWTKSKKGVAHYFNIRYAGEYKADCAVNMRYGGSTDYDIIKCLKTGEKVVCYGYYDIDELNRIWLYCVCGADTGFVCSEYLSK